MTIDDDDHLVIDQLRLYLNRQLEALHDEDWKRYKDLEEIINSIDKRL